VSTTVSFVARIPLYRQGDPGHLLQVKLRSGFSHAGNAGGKVSHLSEQICEEPDRQNTPVQWPADGDDRVRDRVRHPDQ
jgi:hypothetical protein